MKSEPATSVSKGVFLYRGSKQNLDAEQFIKPSHEMDDVNDCKERMKLFKEASANIQHQADLLQEEINLQVFNDLISYLSNVHQHFVLPVDDDDDDQQEFAKKRRKIPSEIPAAALILGVNTPDHEAMFTNLIAMVKKRVSPHVALLKSVKCPNIKSVIAETVTQLTGSSDDMEMNEDDNEEETTTTTTSTRRTLPTMKMVVDWYKSFYKAPADGPSQDEYVCHSVETPTKTPPIFNSPEKKEDLTPRKLSLCLRRISLTSPQKFDPSSVIPAKVVPRSPSPATPSKSPMTSPTRRMTRMSLMSPTKRDLADGELKSPVKAPVRRRKLKMTFSRVKPKCKPLVIILEDFESFPVAPLQDYITILSHHQESVPVILIFGIATTISSVHTLLPYSVSSHLSIHKFQSLPSSAHLTKLLDKILFNSNQPFKLEGRVFNFLLDAFLFNDFSVQNFIRSFKLSMMEHFQTNPSSLLCLPFDLIRPRLEKLSNKQLDHFRSLRSFRRYVERQQPEMQVDLLEDKKFTKKTVMMMMSELHSYHENFFPVLRCLNSLTCNLPQFPLGKTLRELYSFCLHSAVNGTAEYAEACLLIRSLSRSELLSSLKRVIEILESTERPNEQLKEVKGRLEKLSSDLEKFDESAMMTQEENTSAPVARKLPERVDRSTLKKILSTDEKKKVSPDYHLRQEIVDYLEEVFRKHLQHPRAYTLHEVLYFGGVEFLRSRVLPTPRSSLQKALNDPHHYLRNDNLLLPRGQISAKLPDLCIVYKLYLECGKLINLFDWLQAFSTIVEVEESLNDEKEEEDRKPIDRVVQARFVRAVSELQFLGFIKPTRRKTDHVARLTWGSY